MMLDNGKLNFEENEIFFCVYVQHSSSLFFPKRSPASNRAFLTIGFFKIESSSMVKVVIPAELIAVQSHMLPAF